MSIKLIIIPLVLFAVGLIFGAHFFIYRSVLFFVKPVAIWVRPLLIMAFSFLGLSFILSMVAVHYWDNIYVRGYYFIAGSWMALILNLIIFFVAAWAIFWLFKLFSITPPVSVFGYAAIALAIVVTGYSLWNASDPKVVRITIPIQNLPEVWQNKTIVQISDVHLGPFYGVRYAQQLAEQINALQPELIFITGDLFDGMDGKLDELGQSISTLRSKKGTYFITGNHETYLGVEKTLAAIKNGPIKHLNDSLVNIDGLSVVGINYPLRGEPNFLIEKLNKIKVNRPAILLYHEPRGVPEVAKLNQFDLMLSGHTHRGQLWPFEHIVKMIYGKYAYGLNKTGGLYSYTSVGTGTWGPPARTAERSEITAITLTKAED